MNYEEAIECLYSSMPAFHRIGAGAYKPGLDTSRRLDALFGNPASCCRMIHVAGTNGKGSTSHMLAAVLAASGYRTGLYTSPHIFDFRERIRIDGEKIGKDEVVDFVERWLRIKELHPDITPSFFELTSTMAFDHFKRHGVDVAVIEAGLGGRLDSTNIITPVMSVITNISFDHTALLGDTLQAIAYEKAGIIKPAVPVVIGERIQATSDVFIRKAEAVGAPLTFAAPLEGHVCAGQNFYPDTPFGPLRGDLVGECQIKNVSTVLESVGRLKEIFHIPDSAVADGIANVVTRTHLFGRWTTIAHSPLTVCDTGHNQGGWELIVRELGKIAQRPIFLVIGFVADKDLSHILPLLKPLEQEINLIFSAPSSERGLDAFSLAAKVQQLGMKGTVIPDVNDAVRYAREQAGKDGFVLVAGSNFLIADLKVGNPA